MSSEEKIKEIKERARKNFSRGYNCAECIFESVLTHVDTNLPSAVQKIATGLGGGVGLYGGTCGAITGAVISVGAVHGRKKLPKGSDRKNIAKKSSKELYGNPGLYRIFNQIPNFIKQKYGHTLCKKICDPWKEQWLCREHALHCRNIITDAAEFAGYLIYSNKRESSSKLFGYNVENIQDSPSNCNTKS